MLTKEDILLVHTGQNYDYELNQIFFDDLALRKPDHIRANHSCTFGGTCDCDFRAADIDGFNCLFAAEVCCHYGLRKIISGLWTAR